MAGNNINEAGENIDKRKKKNTNDNKPTFIYNYCDYNMKNKAKKNNFLDSIFSATDISGDLEKDLENFKSENGKSEILDSSGMNIDKYEGVNVNSLLPNLKEKLTSEYIILKHRRKTLEKDIFNEYNLDDKEQKLLSVEIGKLTDTNLIDYINSDKKKKAFLNKILGNNLIKREKNSFSSLLPISEDKYNKKIKKINDVNKRKKLISAFTDLKRGAYTDTNFKILIEEDFLTPEQKKEIVQYFIPNISLKQALDLGFLTSSEVEIRKNKLLEKYFIDIDGLDKTKQNDIIKSFSLSEVFISTKDFLSSDNILKLSEEIGFTQIEKDCEELKEEVRVSEENDGPQTFESFKSQLEELKIPGVDKIKEGSIFKFSVNSKEGYREEYYRVDTFNDEKKSLGMSMVGIKIGTESKTKINRSGTNKENKRYCDFIELLNNKDKKKSVSLEIYSKDEFNELISSDIEKFEEEINSLEQISTENLRVNDNDSTEEKNKKKLLQEKIRKELESKYNLELDELLKEKDELELEKKLIQNNSNLDTSEKNKKLEVLNIKIKKLEIFIEDKKLDIGKIRTEDVNIDALIAHKNLNDLIDKINSLDVDGSKLGIKKGIILETKKGAYEITLINEDEQTIDLNSLNGEELGLTYEAFFQAFKENKTKRIKKLNNFEEVLQDNSWDKDYELKDGKLIQNDVAFNGKKENKNIDYFVSSRGDLMKIESIGDGEVEVIFGKLSEGQQDRNTKKTVNKLSLEDTPIKLSLNEFNKIINEDNFKPDWKVGKNYNIENIDGYKNDIKPDFATRFWNRASIMDIYMSGKMLADGIEEYFKKGNDIKSAEFAMKWAKFLPKEMEEDFITQTEMKSAEAMEKELTALGKIASGKAFARILKIIKNKNSPQYKIEAGLMLAAKYGVLYPKALANYNGTFLWYEALGGKIGDELYEKEKEKAEKGGLPFDEKELIISLLQKQSLGRGSPPRRSKFYKEFKGKIAGGFGEEYGVGHRDALEKRNILDINNGGFDEAESGTIPNALGWAKRAVEKGGTLKEMNEIYFSLIFSGALYNAPSNILEELKNHWSNEGNGMILAAFGASLSGQKIFNETVKNVSKQIQAAEPNKYSGIADEAEIIFNNANNLNEDYRDKVKRTRKFWNKYGNVLSRTLFMADGDENDSDFSKTDKIIAFGKDSEYKTYYDHIKIWTPQSTAFKKGFMADAVGPSGVTGLDNFEIVKQHFTFTASRTFRDPEVVSLVWPKIWGDIKSVKQKIKDDPLNENNYKKYLLNKLREVSAGLLSSLGKDLYNSLATSDPAGIDLFSIGIDLSQFAQTRVQDVLNGTDGKKDEFNTAVENVINGNFSGKANIWKSSVFGVTENVQDAVNYAIDDDKEAT